MLKPEPDQLWERACPRRRCVRPCMSQLTHRDRRQASSHLRPHTHVGTRSTVGAGLPAKAACQALHEATDPPRRRCVRQYMSQLTHRYRRQASSHIQPHAQAGTRSTVRAGLPAKAVCQAVHESADPPRSQVSQLPHSTACSSRNPINCESGLAREGGVSGST